MKRSMLLEKPGKIFK